MELSTSTSKRPDTNISIKHKQIYSHLIESLSQFYHKSQHIYNHNDNITINNINKLITFCYQTQHPNHQ